MEPWFSRIPRRLEEEFQALEQAGYPFEVDSAAKEAGHLQLKVKYRLGDEEHDLEVKFPENYPYFPFEIIAPTFPEGRHKNPDGGALCLLKDPLQKWSTEKDRLASFLSTQVPLLVKAHLDAEGAGEIEAHEAAQVTGYFSYWPGSIVFTGDWEVPQECQRGYLLLGLQNDLDPNKILRAAVLEVQDEKGNVLARLDDRLCERHQKKVTGRWLRLPSAPPFDAESAFSQASKAWPDIANLRFNGAPDVVGFLIPEEVEYRRFHENWVFAVRQKTREKKPKAQIKLVHYFARPDQASLRTLQARVPNLTPLFDKKILVVGLGSIGSMYAWQMARAGIGGINLLDFDHLQFGNSPRWLLGWLASGHDKAHLLRHHLNEQYPFAVFKAWQHRIGTPIYGSGRSEAEILAQALDGVDLIFDATAEWCVSHYLSDMAATLNIPYLWATGTPGARGGTIGRVTPGRTEGCWKCFQHKLYDKSFDLPNQADTQDVQPVGCFHSTFTGTGFDMDHVTLAAVRMTAATLCVGHAAYPDFQWDVGIINTWSDQEMPIAPEWKTYKLDRHPECASHAPK